MTDSKGKTSEPMTKKQIERLVTWLIETGYVAPEYKDTLIGRLGAWYGEGTNIEKQCEEVIPLTPSPGAARAAPLDAAFEELPDKGTE